MKLQKNDRILFFGDSITDAGRDKSNAADLGYGYAKMIAESLSGEYPEWNFQFLNRGINGNKIPDLANRLEEDCINLSPTVVSILIGINDTWHRIGSADFGSKEVINQFEREYREVLKRIKEKTNARIVILEPFVLSYPTDRLEWRVDLDPRIQAVRRLANEFAEDFIPLDGLLNAAGMKVGYQALTGEDGVHPTDEGHAFIADAWLKIVN